MNGIASKLQSTALLTQQDIMKKKTYLLAEFASQ